MFPGICIVWNCDVTGGFSREAEGRTLAFVNSSFVGKGDRVRRDKVLLWDWPPQLLQASHVLAGNELTSFYFHAKEKNNNYRFRKTLKEGHIALFIKCSVFNSDICFILPYIYINKQTIRRKLSRTSKLDTSFFFKKKKVASTYEEVCLKSKKNLCF